MYRLTCKPRLLRQQGGFTLLELAVVMIIVTLLLGGLAMPLMAQLEQQKINETRATLVEVREALMGFAITNGRLPCPAISAINGDEKPACPAAADRHGFIPWARLGVSGVDAWGHLLRYSVTPSYAAPAGTLTLSPPTASDITIRARDSTGVLVNLSNTNSIPAVVLSHGKNGFGSTDTQGNAMAAVPLANTDELANATGVVLFVSQTLQVAGSPGGEYDDIVTWISPAVFFNRMVMAKRLP
jgi:prepilin-type N-terminal cleavage/methylation domain-containing protein